MIATRNFVKEWVSDSLCFHSEDMERAFEHAIDIALELELAPLKREIALLKTEIEFLKKRTREINE